jgi:hypothetical protein
MRRPDFTMRDSFANEFENRWRFHCPRWQGESHTIRIIDHAGEGEPMYRVSDGVRSTHGQDGAIVLDVQQGQMFNLNLVGSRILELLEKGSAESDIVNVISREFNASREAVESDVREFIESLQKHKLVADR